MKLKEMLCYRSATTKQIIKYSSKLLRELNRKMKSSSTLHSLDPITASNIRKLKIHKKRKRGKRGGIRLRQNNMVVIENGVLGNGDLAKRSIHKTVLIESKSPILTFGTLNAHSIKNKDEEIYQILVENDLDFAIITETWLQQNKDLDLAWVEAAECNANGFKIHEGYSRKDRKGGGVLMITKTSSITKCELIPHEQLDSMEIAIWKLANKYDSLYVIGLYHPPSSAINPSNMTFLDELSHFIGDLRLKYSKFLIVGDFNIHVNDNSDTDAEQFIDILEVHGLQQLVNAPTHRKGNILDLILVSESLHNKVGNIKTGPFSSDHCWLYGQINTQKPRPPTHVIKYRKLDSIDISEFFTDLRFDFNEDMSLDQYIAEFNTKIITTLDKHAPIRSKKISNRLSKPWFDSNLIKHRKFVRNLEGKFRKYNQHHQWLAFKIERGKYFKRVKAAKRTYISQEIKNNKGDIKTLYEFINTLTGRHKSEETFPDSSSDTDLANNFGDFFLNKILKIRQDLDKYNKFEPTTNTIQMPMESFRVVRESEITKKVKKMKSKTCELDACKSTFIKTHIDFFAPFLTEITNKSLQFGQFSDDWKTAIVRPLMKNKKISTVLKNYRPVSNLSYVSKIVEGMAIDQLQAHVSENNLFPNYQSAYRENHSCETIVLKLCSDILWAMEKKEIFVLIGTDLSAAFDTVDHSIMLNILEKYYGVCDSALQWFKSYLDNRSFKVAVNKAFSDIKKIFFSVPQGSRGGPDLFLLYSATIQNVIS